ncbi:hypothetical protein [Synechococcus sp. RS9916]|uniref:hypothetical protein n=1 Tax=Synechococcus sp. RS9916 TaxID=221359 RepID=UPI00056F22C6|nr:hypothetical protein [Synechococcus sp. RS9916]
MNLQAAAAGAFASLLTVSLLNSTPMLARFDGEEERMWAQFIAADLHHGAPAQAMCMNASVSVESSDEFPLKSWASSVARHCCSSG